MFLNEEVLIRLVLVFIVLFSVLYRFGYKDRFPYIGKYEWKKRPGYQEVYQILKRRVSLYAFYESLPDKSINRLESTVDLVLSAFKHNHNSVELNLPDFDCGIGLVDIHFTITKDEVANVTINED